MSKSFHLISCPNRTRAENTLDGANLCLSESRFRTLHSHILVALRVTLFFLTRRNVWPWTQMLAFWRRLHLALPILFMPLLPLSYWFERCSNLLQDASGSSVDYDIEFAKMAEKWVSTAYVPPKHFGYCTAQGFEPHMVLLLFLSCL